MKYILLLSLIFTSLSFGQSHYQRIKKADAVLLVKKDPEQKQLIVMYNFKGSKVNFLTAKSFFNEGTFDELFKMTGRNIIFLDYEYL